jgi:aromatic-amino-acid transaminase
MLCNARAIIGKNAQPASGNSLFPGKESLVTDHVFSRLEAQPVDGLLGLMLACRADTRPGKIDLGLGVYRDASGGTPVMAAVKAAERILLETQDSKVYLGVDGDTEFVARLAPIVFGTGRAGDERLVGMQTPGGTGALRLAAELVARANPGATLWLGDPTWANHRPIFRAAGVTMRGHPLFDSLTQQVDLDGFLAALDGAAEGDAVLLHGSCHNPTGIDFSAEQWSRIADVVVRRRLLPIVDLAYQGLGRGLDEDAAGMRLLFDRAEALIVAYSCDKNFGLYRERTGALWVRCPDLASRARVQGAMRSPARTSWSMPPDHGAAVVRLILSSEELTADWRGELDAMRQRILGLRAALAAAHPRLAPLAEQTGIFGMLPITAEAVRAIRADHAIYVADDGRANIAGLQHEMIAPLVAALTPYF